jgi:hypothetical protein
VTRLPGVDSARGQSMAAGTTGGGELIGGGTARGGC